MAMAKIPDKSDFRTKGLLLFPVHGDGKVWPQEGNVTDHTGSTVGKHRAVGTGGSLSSFLQPETSAHGMACTHIRGFLLLS